MSRPNGRPAIYTTSEEKKRAHNKHALKCYYRGKGMSDEEITENIRKKQTNRECKQTKKELMRKMKKLFSRIKNDVNELDHLIELNEKISECEGYIPSEENSSTD